MFSFSVAEVVKAAVIIKKAKLLITIHQLVVQIILIPPASLNTAIITALNVAKYLLEQQISPSRFTKLAVLGNTFASMTERKKDLKKPFLDKEFKTVKNIVCNAKLNKGNKGVLALIDFVSEANLISQEYLAELILKILDISYGFADIIKLAAGQQKWNIY